MLPSPIYGIGEKTYVQACLLLVIRVLCLYLEAFTNCSVSAVFWVDHTTTTRSLPLWNRAVLETSH